MQVAPVLADARPRTALPSGSEVSERCPTHPFNPGGSSTSMMRADGRRLARALTLTVLSFLLLGGATGFVLAQGEAGEALQVPAPRPGDAATYEVRMGFDEAIGLGGRGDLNIERVRYEWLPQEWVRDAEFGVRLAAPLEVTYEFGVQSGDPSAYTLVHYYDTTTREVIFRSYSEHYETVGKPISPGIGGPLNLVPVPGSVTDSRVDRYDGDLGTCGVWTPIHGLADGRIDFTDASPCGWPDGSSEPTPGRFTPQGWVDTRPWTGGPRSHSVYFDDADRPDDRMQLGLWFDGKSPFAVRMRHAMAEWANPNQWTLGRVYLMERVSFHVAPANERYELAVSHAGPGPVPVVSPQTPWFVDDSRIGLEFTLAEAYAAALADQGSSLAGVDDTQRTVSQWMSTHPDAYLAFAVTINVEDGSGSPRPEWIMIWADGNTAATWIAKRVSWTSEQAEGIVLPAQTGRRVQVQDWTPTWLPDDTRDFFPSRSQLPVGLADLDTVVARYREVAGADAPFDRYGIQIFCPVSCAGAGAMAFVEAGHVIVPPGGDANVLSAQSTALDKVLVGSDGRLSYRSILTSSSEGLLPGGATAPPAKPSGESIVAASVWVAPPPGAATGVGFFALLVGGMYYFWPVVKGAALGLFSRTRDDELLEHPRRAQVLQLVQAEPGVHFQDLARRLGIGRGTLEHHLRKMLAAGLLAKVQHGGYACYFPKGAVDRRVMDTAPLLRSTGGRAVFDAVRSQPGRSGRELALALGLSQSTVSYHLRRLQEAGLVFGAGDGAGVRLSPLGEQAAA